MRRRSLAGRVRGRRGHGTTDSDHALLIAPNRLGQRGRSVERPNEVWAADITYVPTEEGWLHLAAVLDLGSRRLVGWANRKTSQRIYETLRKRVAELAMEEAKPFTGEVEIDERYFGPRRVRGRRGRGAGHKTPVIGLLKRGGKVFTSIVVDCSRAWLAQRHVKTLYIEPGSPWQNGHVESFHGSLRDECLDRELMLSVAEARVVIEDYRCHYNEERPHGGLGYRTPRQAFHKAQAGNTKVANTAPAA